MAKGPSASRRRSESTSDATTRTERCAANSDENIAANSSGSSSDSVAAELSFGEAQAALELALAELQSPELPVEAMQALYLRARRYAERCEHLLLQVEQSIELWDPQTPQTPPHTYEA